MASKATQRAEEDSADSDDSNSGERPSFSAMDRVILEELLKISNNVIRVYEEHQPELHRVTNQLFKSTKKLSDHHSQTIKAQRRIRMAAVTAGVGFSLGIGAFLVGVISLFSFADDFFLTMAAGVIAGVTSYRAYKINRDTKEKSWKLLETIKNALRNCNTTAGRITTCLKNYGDLAEEILKLKSRFPLQKGEKGDFRKHADALSELRKLFRPEDLLTLLKEEGTLDWREKAKFVSPVPLIRQDTKTLRDLKKLRKRAFMQENDVESEAGQLDWRLKEMTNHVQRILKESRSLTLEVERVMLEVNEHIEQ